jgi:hypothetical protein
VAGCETRILPSSRKMTTHTRKADPNPVVGSLHG